MSLFGGINSKQENDNRVKGTKGNWSLVNKISSVARKISGNTGFVIALAPKQAGGIRSARNEILKYNRLARDANAVMNRNIKKRVINRGFGRAAGLMTNLILPPANNIALRLVRARIGGMMNRRIHGIKKKPTMRIFGPKATTKYHKLLNVNASGNVFLMMQKTLALGMKATAPRESFTMQLKGSEMPIQFKPNNLADSVQMLQPEFNPDKHTIARYTVTAGSSAPGVMVADKAPYVWIANYGGILFDPHTGENDKVYAPSFFAQKALRFTAKLYAPAIKKIAEIVDPHGLGSLATKSILQVNESQRAKAMYKVWLSKDGERVKKEQEFRGERVKRDSKGRVIKGRTVGDNFIEDEFATENALNWSFTKDKSAKFGWKLSRTEQKNIKAGNQYDGRRKKTAKMTYKGDKGRQMGGYYGLPESTYDEALEAGAKASMDFLYGGRKSVVKETHKVKGYKRKPPQKTKDSKRRGKNYRPKGKYKTEEVSEYKRSRTKEYDVGVSLDTGQIPIVADMRMLKASDKGRARYIAGKGNRYKSAVLDTAEVKIAEHNMLDLGMIKMTKETREQLKYARAEGVIDFKFKGNKVTNAVVLDLKRFETIMDIEYGERQMYSLGGTYKAASAKDYGDLTDKQIQNMLPQLKKDGIRLTQKELAEVNKQLRGQIDRDITLKGMRVWDDSKGKWTTTKGGNIKTSQYNISNNITYKVDSKGNPVITSSFAKDLEDMTNTARTLQGEILKLDKDIKRYNKQFKAAGLSGGGAGGGTAAQANIIERLAREGSFSDSGMLVSRDVTGVEKFIDKFGVEREKQIFRENPIFVGDDIVTKANYKTILSGLQKKSDSAGSLSKRQLDISIKIEEARRQIDMKTNRLFGKTFYSENFITVKNGKLVDTKKNTGAVDIDDVKDLFLGTSSRGMGPVQDAFLGSGAAAKGTLADQLLKVQDIIEAQQGRVRGQYFGGRGTGGGGLQEKLINQALINKGRNKGYFDSLTVDKDVSVSAVSGKLKAVSNQGNRNRQSARSTDSGLVRLSFKVDESQQLRLREKTGGYYVEVRQPRLRGVNQTRDRRTDTRRRIYASDTQYSKNSVLFEFNDPALPTEMMTLKVGLKNGKIQKNGIDLKTKSGGEVRNVTRKTGTGVMFVDEGEGRLRMARINDNIAPEKQRRYGLTGASNTSPQFADNAAILMNASPSDLNRALAMQPQSGMRVLSDISILTAALKAREDGIRYRHRERDYQGYRVGKQKGKGYIIRFEDL